MLAMPGGETLTELRQCLTRAELECEGGASPRVSPFADVRDAGSLLQRAGFALPVVDVDRITVSYADPLRLLRDLGRMGEGNALLQRRPGPLRRPTLARACQLYGELFADADGPRAGDLRHPVHGRLEAASEPAASRPGAARAASAWRRRCACRIRPRTPARSGA